MTLVSGVEIVSTGSKSNSTLINLVLDETGSMQSCLAPTISSVNEFLNSQRKVQGECKVNLFTFSHKYVSNQHQATAEQGFSAQSVRHVHNNVHIEDVQGLSTSNYQPNGGTNLYDAIGISIAHVSMQLANLAIKPAVLMVIVTDGEENASKEYKLNTVKAMIASKQAEGWTFVYLGANQDAWQVGSQFGLSRGQTMSYNVAQMSSTMNTLSASTSAYRNLRASGAVAQNSVAQNFFDHDGLPHPVNPSNDCSVCGENWGIKDHLTHCAAKGSVP